MAEDVALGTDGLLLAANHLSASTPISTKRSLPILPAFCWPLPRADCALWH